MPPPERILAWVQKATILTRATSGRQGLTLRLPDAPAGEVLIAGDLHGHIPNFQAILKAADLAQHPQRHLVLQEVIHSEFYYPNGSDKSHQLLDLFAALKNQYPERVHLLPGNHELAQMTQRTIGKGDIAQNELFRRGVTTAYGETATAIYESYLELLRVSPVAIYAPNGLLLTHSLTPAKWLGTLNCRTLMQEPLPEREYQPGGVVYGIVWGRDTAPTTVDDYLRKMDADWLVTGHIPTDEGFALPNHRQLILDCAARPAGYALLPTTSRLTFEQIRASVRVLPAE